MTLMHNYRNSYIGHCVRIELSCNARTPRSCPRRGIGNMLQLRAPPLKESHVSGVKIHNKLERCLVNAPPLEPVLLVSNRLLFPSRSASVCSNSCTAVGCA